jgi:hypothetical protein
MPLTNGSEFYPDSDPDVDPDPAIFVTKLQDDNKKLILKKSFLLISFEGTGTLTSFFKDKKSKRSHKTVRIKVFLTILLNDRRMIEGSETLALTPSLLYTIAVKRRAVTTTRIYAYVCCCC